MQRIDSPSAVANMFGAGKNGFTDTPPNKTALNATWFNEVQEELCAILEDQGITLDGLQLDQIAQAINSWTFSGTPHFSAGLTAENASGNAVAGTSSAGGAAGVRGVHSGGGMGLAGVSSSGTGVEGTSTTGTGIVGLGGGANPGVSGVGGATGVGVEGTGGATSGHGVTGAAQGAASYGVSGTGANAANSHGVVGTAVNTANHGTVGTTAAAATSNAAGVFGNALGDGRAIFGQATDGNAGEFQSDTSSPKRAAVRIVPQDADPTTTQSGALFNASSRLGKMRIHTGTQYESLHSSPKGYVFGVSALSTSANTTTSGDIGDVTIVAEEIGIVILHVTGTWVSPTTDDTATLTVVLKDITGAATIVTSQAFITIDRDGEVGATRVMPINFRYPFTLPAAGTRLFRYRLNVTSAGAAVNWYNTFMTVEGVF